MMLRILLMVAMLARTALMKEDGDKMTVGQCGVMRCDDGTERQRG